MFTNHELLAVSEVALEKICKHKKDLFSFANRYGAEERSIISALRVSIKLSDSTRFFERWFPQFQALRTPPLVAPL